MLRLPMFPLSAVLFPGAVVSLHVFEPRYRQLTADCLQGSGEFGVVLISRGSEVGGGDQRVDVGTVAHIDQASPFPDGRWHLLATGGRRVQVVEWLEDDPYPLAVVEDLPEPPASGPEAAVPAGAGPAVPAGPEAAVLARAEAAVRRARALLSELGQQPALVGQLGPDGPGGDLSARCWHLCGLAPLTPFDGQRLLRIDDPGERLAELAELVEATAEDLSRLLAGG